MLAIAFTEEERKALHHERFHHPHPRVQQKMEALWLKSHNLPHAQIAELVQISEETLRAYLRAYQEGGIEKLKAISWQGPESELSQHQGTLKNFFCKIRQRLSRTRPRRSKG
jgi:transposase